MEVAIPGALDTGGVAAAGQDQAIKFVLCVGLGLDLDFVPKIRLRIDRDRSEATHPQIELCAVQAAGQRFRLSRNHGHQSGRQGGRKRREIHEFLPVKAGRPFREPICRP